MFAMIDDVTHHWWVFLIQGLLAVVFGVLALAQPGITLESLILLFAIWVTADGVLALFSSMAAAEAREPWWPLVFTGILGIGVGIITFKWPGITALALLALISFWSILRGVLEVVTAVRLRQVIEGEFWLGLSGVASILFGVALVVYPAAGALAVVWLIGIYAIVFGFTLVMLGFKLKGAQTTVHVHQPAV